MAIFRSEIKTTYDQGKETVIALFYSTFLILRRLLTIIWEERDLRTVKRK